MNGRARRSWGRVGGGDGWGGWHEGSERTLDRSDQVTLAQSQDGRAASSPEMWMPQRAGVASALNLETEAWLDEGVANRYTEDGGGGLLTCGMACRRASKDGERKWHGFRYQPAWEERVEGKREAGSACRRSRTSGTGGRRMGGNLFGVITSWLIPDG
ncbi:hypothetical protein LZ30DRAFT_93724 [Colletotrichum cereale]|nr:hypothetical protein LZ30DRAFT_93724 [Colletotrichum cereale]